MRWLKNEDIVKFVNMHDYDVRKTGNARWIDQKCTADVLCIVADCIENFLENDENLEFTSRDIWFSDYTVQNVKNVFKKVGVDDESAENEYDKFFQQPMKLMAYAGILEERKKGRLNIYSLKNMELLQYLALREKNVLFFLGVYIEKVLKDSGIWGSFEDFFVKQDKYSYETAKVAFQTFTKSHTSIGKRTNAGGNNANAGVVECNRIFIKIINPLAYFRNKNGTERGHLSKHPITYDMLMYNRDNFRDIYAEKPKSMARKDYISKKKFKINEEYYQYLAIKAKRQLRLFNDIHRGGTSEISGENEKATQIHHIFLASEFPQISHYLENLIALTPNQHYLHAHPMNKTTIVDKEYQYICLVAKTGSIKENIEKSSEPIYSFDNYKAVLSTGLDNDEFMEIEECDYGTVLAKLSAVYG